MTSDKWAHAFVLLALAGGLTAADAFADELLDLSRSVRWANVPLQETPPADLSVNVPHDAKALRFTELVYGTPDSRRVAVVVVETGEGEFALYADRNRDRVIRERELVTGEGDLRMMSLAAEQVDGVFVKHFPRRVLLRWVGRKTDLSIATATRIERSVFPDGDETAQALGTRQIDGNANGLFADAKDWLQIDLNDDDRFAPFLETFPFRPLINAGGRRWFAKADSFAERLHLESATATGSVRITARAHSNRDMIEELIGTLAGEDGSVFSFMGVNATTELPVGKYAASVLFAAIKSGDGDRVWQFTFSRAGGISSQDWLQIKEGETIDLDPIGELVLDATVERLPQEDSARLLIQPRLFTGSGLLINLCRVEPTIPSSGPQCQLSVLGVGDQAVDRHSSGFS